MRYPAIFRPFTVTLIFVSIAVLAGCRGYHGPKEAPPVVVPPSFSINGTHELDAPWWRKFPDPEMWSVVEKALNENFTIKSSYERVKKASAILGSQRSYLFPWIHTGADLTHWTKKEQGDYFNQDQISLDLSVSYELDLWGRIRSGVAAAKFDYVAQKADYEAARLSLSSEVASKYYEIVALKEQKRIIDRQIDRNRASLRIIDEKYRFGQTDALDLLQQTQLVQQNLSMKISVQKSLETAQKELAILVGMPPERQSGPWDIQADRELPSLPPLPRLGVPSTLLKRRPDCYRAFMRLKAANRRLSEAVANQYPQINLTGDIMTSSSAAKDLFENWIATLSAGLLAPIFEGGRLKAQVQVKEAEAYEALYNYGQTILVALKEVEDSLWVERRQRQLIENLRSRLDLARKTSGMLKEKYLAGEVEYLRFLTSELNVDDLERQLVEEQLKLVLNRIRLYKAIAGPVTVSNGQKGGKVVQ